MSDARVLLWGSTIGAVSWVKERELAVFQYDPAFVHSGIQLSPLVMPLNDFPYEFPGLPRVSFHGLPGLLADSLPDKFGNALIDAWLETQARTKESFNSVERLCYIGSRGMGALEYEPAIFGRSSRQKIVEIAELVKLTNLIMDQRTALSGNLAGKDDREALEDILRVGTSAGGARAKAILAWNPETKEFRSGQVAVNSGFEHWILKFDGIQNNRDKELADPQGFGKIEYAYYLMALDAGIKMTKCRLHEEGGRNHFMTKRFDRTNKGEKLHMQTLGALAHFDYNQPASYSYEQALQTMKRLNLSQEDLEQQVLRAMFNVIGRNQDDHVKNITFLMNRRGEWRLSPAYDVTYAYDPNGNWTGKHQMSINGKRDNFEFQDLLGLAELAGIKNRRARFMVDKSFEIFRQWPEYAQEAGVEEERVKQIQMTLRLNLG